MVAVSLRRHGRWVKSSAPHFAQAAGQRDAVSRAVARDKPVATSVVIPR